MPTFLVSGGARPAGLLRRPALLDGQRFDLRAFTSLEASATGNPFGDALAWALNPFPALKTPGELHRNAADSSVDLTAP